MAGYWSCRGLSIISGWSSKISFGIGTFREAKQTATIYIHSGGYLTLEIVQGHGQVWQAIDRHYSLVGFIVGGKFWFHEKVRIVECVTA